MHKIPSLLSVGAAALALGSVPVFAGEKEPATHEMTVRTPGGGVAQIEYTGDTPPKVTFETSPPAFESFWPDKAAFESSFKMFDRLSREMDRRTKAMLERANALHDVVIPTADALMQAAMGTAEPGSSFSYTYVSTANGTSCTRSVEITTPASGGKPEVIKRTTGDCEPEEKADKPASDTTPL